MKKKVIDFVHNCQAINCVSDIVKGTQVSFKLPKKLQYEFNGNTVELDLGIVVSHEDGEYTLSYKGEEVKVKAEDIYFTKQQMEKYPLSDSVLFTNAVTVGNENDMINMKNRLLPDVTQEQFDEITSALYTLTTTAGDVIVCYITDDPEDVAESGNTIAPISIDGLYFHAYTR